MNFNTLLILLALAAFALAAWGRTFKKTDLIAIGLALWSLADLVGRLPSLTLSTIVMLLAFVAFVAAAIGWRYRKVNLIAVGLGLWTLSLLVGTLIR